MNTFKFIRLSRPFSILTLAVLISALSAALAPAQRISAAFGTISLSEYEGSVGTPVDIVGSGFTISENYTVMFATTAIQTGSIDSYGDFDTQFLVPARPRGDYRVTVTTTSDNSNVEYFTITPLIVLDLASGHSGAQVKVSGSGFMATSGVTILYDGASIGSVNTNSNGAFSNYSITIPHSLTGKHQVAGRDIVGPSPEVSFSMLKPEFSIGLRSGHVGDQILVSGSGFKPSSIISILLDSTSIGSVSSDASGAFSNAPVIIPPGSKGSHTIAGKDTLNTSSGVSFEITESLVINPVTGSSGDVVKISGSGFEKKSTIIIDFDNTVLKTSIVADAAGTFSGTFEVPEASFGEHTVRIKDNSGNLKESSFTIVQNIIISPTTGSSGTMIKVNGTGFSTGRPVPIKFNGTPVATDPAAVSTNERGSFYAVFEVPACLAGNYVVETSDGTNSATARFTSVLTATISYNTSQAAPGHVGMQLLITGAGFNPNKKITVTRATIQEPMGTTVTSDKGTFSVDFVVPPSPGGKHTIIITDGVNTKEFEFYIEQEAPSTPSLLIPEEGVKATKPVFFDWKDISDQSGVSYTLQVSTDKKFEEVLLEKDNLTKSELILLEDSLKSVTKDNPYYWKVKARDGAFNESGWSEIRSFSVGFVLTLPNGEPELTLPARMVYVVSALICVLILLSFLLGKKASRSY